MTLLELQRRMMKAVMQPLTSSDRIAPKTEDGRPMKIEAAEFITPNSRTHFPGAPGNLQPKLLVSRSGFSL